MNAPTSPVMGPTDRFGNLEAVRGETYEGEILICESNGVTPVDLSGYEVGFYLWGRDDALVLNKEPEVTAADGQIDITLTSTETEALEPIAYHFELWADNGEGQRRLLLWGWFWVKGECTH